MKFRKKPVVIDATEWNTHGDVRGVEKYDDPTGEWFCGYCGGRDEIHGWIDTREGGHIVCPGDWIITGVAGEVYPCKPAIFEATYEPVEDQ